MRRCTIVLDEHFRKDIQLRTDALLYGSGYPIISSFNFRESVSGPPRGRSSFNIFSMNIVAFKTCEADKVSEVPDSALARQVQGDSKDRLTEQGIARTERGQRRKAARAKLCEDEEQLKQQ